MAARDVGETETGMYLVGEQVTVTLPLGVDYGLTASSVITNTASVTSDQVSIPVSASVNIMVAEQDTKVIYLILIDSEDSVFNSQKAI